MGRIILFLLMTSLSFSFVLPASAKKKKEETTELSGKDLKNIKTAVENHGLSLATVGNQVNEIVSKFQIVSGDAGRNFQKNKEQDKVLRDYQMRMQVLEDQITILTSQLSELQKEGLLPKETSQRFREYQKYARGLQYINAQDYDKAVSELKRFKAENKKSIYKSYAQYWIGESFYMQGDYPMAIKQYQNLLSKNSKSAKAPTALYRQGLSFYQLQSFEDAKAFFTKVIRSYPKSIEAIQASAQIKRIKNIETLRKQQELEMKMIQ